ncbi:hypothetical protein ACP275_09G064400 [Erythranthe tilingii]
MHIVSSSEEGPRFFSSGKIRDQAGRVSTLGVSQALSEGDSLVLSEVREPGDHWGPSTLSDVDLTNLVKDIELSSDVELILPSSTDRPLTPPPSFSTWFLEQFYFGLFFCYFSLVFRDSPVV